VENKNPMAQEENSYTLDEVYQIAVGYKIFIKR